MANNVFEQTVDREIYISSNQIACTIIEHLLPYTNAQNLERFQNAFAENFRPICSDKFASHILEKLVEISFLRAVSSIQIQNDTADTVKMAKKRKTTNDIAPNEKQYNLSETFDTNHIKKCSEFVVKISKFLLNNLEDFVWDQYGCHIIRTCILSLCGIFVFKRNDYISTADKQDINKIILPADKEIPLTIPDEWIDIIREYASRLQQWPHFAEFPYDELSSGLLQCLCIALRTVDKNALKHFGKKILNAAFIDPVEIEKDADDDDDKDKKTNENEVVIKLPKVFTSGCALRLLETMLCTAGQKLFTQLYAMLFVGRTAILSTDKSANFAIQKLLDNVKEKDDFESIFDELSSNVEELLRIGYTGVVNALCQACLRLCTKQGAFIQSLQSALHCAAPPERISKFTALTIQLKPYEIVMNNEKSASVFVHLHGSLILQAMLSFNKPIRLVQCLMETNANELCEIFSSPKGSHIVDAFLQSKTIGEKSREKFIKHLNGCYLEMAMSRHGSRAVEKLFDAGNDGQKIRIVKELAEKLNQLNSSPTGRLLNYKFRVDTYKLSPAQWKAAFNKENKAEKLFKDLI